jgi:hypothetical protein
MEFSFIFCYRNRETHLNITIPRIRQLYPNSEIIVVEQNDTKKFRRANLLNVGANAATNEVIVLHDIDYYPTDGLEYWDGESSVFLPVRFVEFVYNDLTPKPLSEVPGGYRHFKDGVDANFHGGVTTFKRADFLRINGFSPLYVGWGFEDADLRERIAHGQLIGKRSLTNKFLALDHPDSGPAPHDADFAKNIQMAQQWQLYADKGVTNQPNKLELVTPKHSDVDQWILATEFDGPPKPTHIVQSTFDWAT